MQREKFQRNMIVIFSCVVIIVVVVQAYIKIDGKKKPK